MNLSLANKGLPHYSTFPWHLHLISILKENNAFIVHAAGNNPGYGLSAEHNEFESIIDMSDCVLLNLANSWFSDFLAMILKKILCRKTRDFVREI